ncbi:hypothetical protein [Streptomyces sp. Ag109_O5-1]|uniref:hypothetical protein n=1 Tax=Streptomyces sp. Ag109_O5-1 TaxID=1938851 RepID=UPI000F5142C7|nr:hypothetical protein [Streptomyces sp. Ag109_O5-1]
MVIGSLTSASVLFKIGVTDALGALTYTGRIEGSLFLIAAILETVTAIAVFDHWGKRRLTYSGAIILVGVTISLLVSLLLLSVQIYGGEYTHYLWLWLALLIWSAWALRRLEPHHILKEITHPKSLAVGAVVSAFFVASNFAYTQVYIPYASPVQARVIAKLGTPSMNQKRTILYLPVELHYQNSGKVGFTLLGSQYSVYGRTAKFVERPNRLTEWKDDMEKEPMSDLYRHTEVQGRNLISAGEFFRAGNSLDPDQEFVEKKIVEFPAGAEYDSIEVVASATAIRTDRGDLDDVDYSIPYYSWDTASAGRKHLYDAPGWVAQPGDEYIAHHAQIHYGSEILNMTRKPRYVTYWRVIRKEFSGANPENENDFTEPYNALTISELHEEAREPSTSDYDELYDRYGLQETYSPWLRESLPALLKAAGR